MSNANGRGGRPLVLGIGGTMRPGSTSLAALRYALASAQATGAATELFDLKQLGLPIYDPERSLDQHAASTRHFVSALREADALVVSTAAYQGTLAGITKNALDYAEFLAADDPPYLTGKPVGLIATAAGGQAAPNAIATLVQVVHALRGVVVPFTVPIPQAWGVFPNGSLVAEEPHGRRLDELGRMVVDLAARLSVADRAERRPVEGASLERLAAANGLVVAEHNAGLPAESADSLGRQAAEAWIGVSAETSAAAG